MPRRKTTPSEVKVGEKLIFTAGPVEWIEAAADDGDKVPKFNMTAYTGGSMQVGYYFSPVVLDLTGIKPQAEETPALLNHDDTKIVGHGTAEITARTIKLAGLVSGGGEAAREVKESSRQKFPWKASVGIMPNKTEFVEQGATAKANGRLFKGPVNIVRGGELLEVSFVPIAADGKTRVSVAAKHGEKTMEKKLREYIEAKGFNPDELSEEQVAGLQASYDLENAEPEPTRDPPPVKAKGSDGADEGADDYLKVQAAQRRLVAEIDKVCDGYPAIAAEAIEAGWDVDRTQDRVDLQKERDKRPSGPAIHAGGRPAMTGAVIEAAACRTLGVEDVEEQYDEKTLEAADNHFQREIGLQEMLVLGARQNGWTGQQFRNGDLRQVLAHAFPPIQAAGAQTAFSLSGILSNVANKMILESFNHVESAWREISAVGTLNDFKTHTRYRLTGDAKYEQLAPDGQIVHGTLDEESTTISLDTYAKMYSLDRRDIINDDLGALDGIKKKLGRGAALKINVEFWTAFMANTDFFKTANSNLLEGTAYALTATDPIAALAGAELLFLDQTDPDSNPIAVTPSILLMPNALGAHGRELMESTSITTGGASSKTKQGTKNIYAGQFRPVLSSYLGNSSYTGYSTTGWYLLADPRDMAVIETGFLNGKQSPTVESSDADFDTLGIKLRGYHDFGFALQEYRGGVKVTGVAA